MIQNWGQNSAAEVDWQNMSEVVFIIIMWVFDWGGGHLPWKVVWGCAAVMTPFFRPVSTPNLPSMCRSCAPPPFSILRKNLYFQPCFLSKFQLSRCKFAKFLFPRLLIFQRNVCSLVIILFYGVIIKSSQSLHLMRVCVTCQKIRSIWIFTNAESLDEVLIFHDENVSLLENCQNLYV